METTTKGASNAEDNVVVRDSSNADATNAGAKPTEGGESKGMIAGNGRDIEETEEEGTKSGANKSGDIKNKKRNRESLTAKGGTEYADDDDDQDDGEGEDNNENGQRRLRRRAKEEMTKKAVTNSEDIKERISMKSRIEEGEHLR